LLFYIRNPETRMGWETRKPEWDGKPGNPDGKPGWDGKPGNPDGMGNPETRMGWETRKPEWDGKPNPYYSLT
jgi:hypothetical protein